MAEDIGTWLSILHCRVDDFLLAQQDQTANDLITQFRFQLGMVQAKQGHEIGREVGGEFGIAIGAVGNEIDQLSETDQTLRIGRARSLHEELQKGLVLAVLVVEVILV